MKIATSIIESELSLPPTAMGRDVRMLFEAHPELLCIALVDDGRPVGLISKSAFLRRYADELGPALFERRPAALLANTAPMIVEADDPVTELLDIAENGSANQLMDGFIVADQGRFAGVSSLFALLRATRARADELQFLFSDLESAHQQALAADAAKAQFLATMTHELRTPLNAILGYSELIAEEAGQDHEAICSDAQKITTAGRHLLGLINQVLDFSKIEAGQMQPEPEEFDIAAWAEESIVTIRPLAAQNKNVLSLEVEAGVGRAYTDADRLRQCLFNLTGNACKFTSNGRVHCLGVPPWRRSAHQSLGYRHRPQRRTAGAFVQAVLAGRFFDFSTVWRNRPWPQHHQENGRAFRRPHQCCVQAGPRQHLRIFRADAAWPGQRTIRRGLSRSVLVSPRSCCPARHGTASERPFPPYLS